MIDIPRQAQLGTEGEKSALILEKKALIVSILMLNLPFKM